MPIDNIADCGTEKDGLRSEIYCKYCYQDGKFVNPDMTLAEMKELLITQMGKMNLPKQIVQQSLDALPQLKRWRQISPEHAW